MSPFLKPLASVALVSSLLLFGCQTATDTKSSSPTATVPTTTLLTGTWKGSVSGSGTGSNSSGTFNYTVTDTTTVTITPTTWIAKTVEVETPSNGAASTVYFDYKGTYTLAGDQLTQTTTDQRSSILAPFADDTAGWTTLTTAGVETRPIVLIDGKLYGVSSSSLVFKAQGSHDGLVGTWVYEDTNSQGGTTSYEKTTDVLTATTISGTSLSGTSATDPAMQSRSGSLAYVNNGNGTLTITSGTGASAQTQTMAFLVAGDYLTFGNRAGAFGEYTRQ
jgi:hypothetical protein